MLFEKLFSYPLEAFATGTFLFANVFQPLWWLTGAGVVVVIITISVMAGVRTKSLVWWRRLTIAGLQIAVALGVIALLAGPVLQTTTLQHGANNIAVLIDTSGSMSFPNANDEQTRLNAALELLELQLIPALSGLAEMALFTFDNSAVRRTMQHGDSVTDAFSIEATDAETNLIASTASVLDSFKGAPLAAVIVLSDGADNGDNSTVDMAALAAHGVPVHTIGFGAHSLPGEVQLVDVQMAADAPPASRVSALLVIEHTTSGEAVIHVRDGGVLLAIQRVQLSAKTPTVRTEITFDSGGTGIRELSFELTPPPGDVLAENNQIHRLLTVNDRRRRFLYLEGEPRWEYKFIRRAVAGDEVLELVSWLRTTDRKTYRQGVSNEDELADGFPPDLESLYGYDVIILGSIAATSFTEEQHEWLESFVSHRGGSHWPRRCRLFSTVKPAPPTGPRTAPCVPPGTGWCRPSPSSEPAKAQTHGRHYRHWAIINGLGRSNLQQPRCSNWCGEEQRVLFWSPSPMALVRPRYWQRPLPGVGRCVRHRTTSATACSGANCFASWQKQHSGREA